jgi:hypothetical protein
MQLFGILNAVVLSLVHASTTNSRASSAGKTREAPPYRGKGTLIIVCEPVLNKYWHHVFRITHLVYRPLHAPPVAVRSTLPVARNPISTLILSAWRQAEFT